MPQSLNKKSPDQDRSQQPLWFAVGGLVISVFSYGLHDLMVGDVVFWFGLCLAVVGLLYWFVKPRHGL
jgi:hypothetical protein